MHCARQRAAACVNNADLDWLYTRLSQAELRQLLADRRIRVPSFKDLAHEISPGETVSAQYRQLLRDSDVTWASTVPVKQATYAKHGVARRSHSDVAWGKPAVNDYCAELYSAPFGRERAFLGVHSQAYATDRLQCLVEGLRFMVEGEALSEEVYADGLMNFSKHRRRAREMSENRERVERRRNLQNEDLDDFCACCQQLHLKASPKECTL